MNLKYLKGKENERNFVIVILFFVILILIIFLVVRNLGFIDHKMKIPTGNVDIFDIIFKKDCNCDCDNNSSCNNCGNTGIVGGSTGGNTSSNVNPSIPDTPNVESPDVPDEPDLPDNPSTPSNPSVSEDIPLLEVFDKDTEYSQDTELNIFTNTAYYVVENKIAPMSENTYQFVIRNNNDFNIRYDLDLFEENIYNINMKYRLKLNGEYVSGNDDTWLTCDELKQESIGLAGNTYDVYTLDWKWFEGSNDTEVGTNVNSNYKLELKITASGY